MNGWDSILGTRGSAKDFCSCTGFEIGLLALGAASAGSAVFGGGGSGPSVPGLPKTPLSDPVKTQAELDTEARRVRVKRARLAQTSTGVRTTPLGLSPADTQRTLPTLTGQ